MNYITTTEAAEKWGISRRRVSLYCKDGRIPGAEQKGVMWLIPEDAENLLTRGKQGNLHKKISRGTTK